MSYLRHINLLIANEMIKITGVSSTDGKFIASGKRY